MNDEILVSLFYAAQGDITKFRIKARALLSASIADTAGAKPVAWMREYMSYPDSPEDAPGFMVTDFHQNAAFAAQYPDENTPLYAAPPAPSVADTAGASSDDAWPSAEDAAIKACALMIRGICMTRPQDEWTAQIEKRIRFMLKESK